MKKTGIILTLLLNFNFAFSQTKSDIDSLLTEIVETQNSKEIIKTEQAEKIISYGENTLLTLSEFFTDQTLTRIKSDCQERNLTKGEIAIILADRIKSMPYFRLTKIQNCTLTFCENNPNLIEYYFWAIKRDGVENFKKEYVNWLNWNKLSKKEKREIERKSKSTKNNTVYN